MSSRTPPLLPHQIGTYCQDCQKRAPTKFVTFYQHIGAILLMFNRRVQGLFCRSCVNQRFASTTLITGTAGWWGIISFFITPCVLVHNLIRYLMCLTLPPPRPERARNTGLAIGVFIFALTLISLFAYVVISIVTAGPSR
jgi:hypothetical protein